MTTTTPESRGSLARTAYLRMKHHPNPVPESEPMFDDLPLHEQECWVNAARVIWDIATTGRSTL
jgi:hypothetical protein